MPIIKSHLNILCKMSFISRYIVSTRIRTGRSIEGFPFNPNMTEEQYRQMEEKSKKAFDEMPDSLKGDYFPLTGMYI